MPTKALIEALDNTALNILDTIEKWPTLDPVLKEHYSQEIVRTLSASAYSLSAAVNEIENLKMSLGDCLEAEKRWLKRFTDTRARTFEEAARILERHLDTGRPAVKALEIFQKAAERPTDLMVIPIETLEKVRKALDAAVNRRRYEEHEWGQIMEDGRTIAADERAALALLKDL